MFVRECPENPGNTCTCVGSIAYIYSLYSLTFNLAIKTVNVTKMTHAYAMQYSKTERLRQKLGYV